MKELKLYFLFCYCLLYHLPANAQTTEKTSYKNFIGSYSENGVSLKIKKNHTFKTRFVAPRPLIYKGIWEIKNDTMYCYNTKCNTSLNGQVKKIKGKPIAYTLILKNGKVYDVKQDKLIELPKKK